jgi:tRNA modification GTPase
MRSEAASGMFSPDDTIVAIATPPGRGGLGVVRISGSDACEVAGRILVRDKPLQPRYATFTRVRASDSDAQRPVDEVIATWFPAPRSYTGEHVVELSTHGSPIILQQVLKSAIDAGARLARPGEFTLRAFVNGRMDLVQAEAVADLIDAVTPLQARVAFDQLEGTLTAKIAALDARLLDLVARLEASLDFPDEGYHFIEPRAIACAVTSVIDDLDRLLMSFARGRIIREGATVVIAGRPNVGKSSLFNALVGHSRAIVTETAGTTRDLVTETCDIDGLRMTLVDTAGVRDTTDRIEIEGVWRGTRAREVADLIVVVLDAAEALMSDDARLLTETTSRARVIVANKSDQPAVWRREDAVCISATSGAGLDALRQTIVAALGGGEPLRDSSALTNVRHTSLLEHARANLARARAAAEQEGISEEFLLADLHGARASLGEVVGTHTSEDVLEHIFERFCIGK